METDFISDSSFQEGNTKKDSTEQESINQESTISQSKILEEIKINESILFNNDISIEKNELDDYDPTPAPQEENEETPKFCITYNQYLTERAHHNFIWKFLQESDELSKHQSLLKILKFYLDKSEIKSINNKLEGILKNQKDFILIKKLFEFVKQKDQQLVDDRKKFEAMTDGQIISIQIFHYCAKILEEQGKQQIVSTLKCPFEPVENKSLKRFENLQNEQKFIELSGDKFEECSEIKYEIFLMIQQIIQEDNEDIQLFADEIVEKFENLDKGEFYVYLYQIFYEVIEVLQITNYFSNLQKPNEFQNLPDDKSISAPLIQTPVDLNHSDELIKSDGNTPNLFQQALNLSESNTQQNLNKQINEEEQKSSETNIVNNLNDEPILENQQNQTKISLFTFTSQKIYYEKVENAIMKSSFRARYERKFQNFIDELENEADLEAINIDLKSLAETQRKINDLDEKLKEIIDEQGLVLNNENLFQLTDYQIIALNIFFKLENHLQEQIDLLLGIKCPVELPKQELQKQKTFLNILTNPQYYQMVEQSINNSSIQLRRIYTRNYNNILDIIDEQVDFQDINIILNQQAQPLQNSYINEIREQIILNAQQQEIDFNIQSQIVLSDSQILALNMFFKVKDQLNDRPDLQALIHCPIEIPEEPAPIPEPIVIDYWLKFQSLESEEKFIQLSGQNFENYKGRKNIIKKKIDNLIECLQRDSEEGIQDNQREINRYLDRFDQNSEFLKYFKFELKNVIIQLKLEEYFEGIIDFQNEPEEIKINQHQHEQEENKINNLSSEEQKQNEQNSKPVQNNKHVFDFSEIKVSDYQQRFQQDFMTLDLNDLFYNHSKLLQNFEYLEQLKIRNLVKEKYPNCQEQTLKSVKDINLKINDHIEQGSPENERNRLVNEIKPLFAQIYEFESKQEISSLVDEPQLNVYDFMVSLVQTVCPSITIQKPMSLQDQQIQQLSMLKEFLPSLGRKISIQEYGTLDENSSIQNQKAKLIENFQKTNKLDGEILLKILFDLIKRRVDFKELLQDLSIVDNKNNLTQLILFQYILEHSDPQLKVLLCITCAYFMPLPLFSFNPWQENQEINKLQMTPDLLYIYEKCKSLIQFKLSPNKKSFSQSENLYGCTFLLNKLFGREFSLNEQNLINFGTVEIQMDLNCADAQHLVIADAHGFIDIQTLKQIFPLFDGFIIHVSENNFNNQEIQSDLDLFFKEIVQESDSEKTILIIKHDSQNLSFEPRQWENIGDRRLKVFEICTQNLQSLPEIRQQNLIRSIHNTLNNFFQIEVEIYKSTPDMRLKSKKVFFDALKKIIPEKDLMQYQEALDELSQIIHLITNQENLKGIDFLPMLNYISRQSILQDIITSENTSQKDKNDARFELKQIQRAIKDIESTEISNLFSDIVFKHHCMSLLPSLSSIVKGFLENKLKYIIQERDKKKAEYDQTQLENRETREFLEQKIKDLNQAVDESWFSTELLSRELFYLGQNSRKSSITKEDYYQLVRHFEQTAQPFELVDGDTLNFTTDVYQEVFQDYDHEDLLVVCILGPQSSGKSLLMNYLFGTSFLSSSGRCTKGVYASILRFKDKDEKYKRILILDTEGIQSSEARDTTFDKRIVYYAICVSHVVLMCNKGEMNAPMSETIKLVADAIVNTSMPFLKNPTIYIILNMLANPNDKTQLECINEVNQTLRELAAAASRQNNNEQQANSKQMVDQVLRINQDSLIPLGFAFNTFQFGSNIRRTVNKPSPEFAFRTMKLRQQILSKFDEIQNSKSTKYSLKDWFNHAQNFWTFSRDCRQLREYSSLSQKRVDDELMLEIDRIIKQKYVDNWKSVLKAQIQSELEAIFSQYQGGAAVRFQNLNNQIQLKIAERYNLIQAQVLEEYIKFCQEKSVSLDLREKRKQIVNRKKEFYEKQALQYCRVNLSKFQEKKSQLVGDTILHEETIRLLKEKGSYQIQEANDEFQKSWEKSIKQIQDGISNNDELIYSSQKSVTDEFKYLLNHTPQYDTDYFALARNGPKDEWQQQLTNQFQKDGLMFNGDSIAPNIKVIIESQERQRKYTKENLIKIFEDRTTYRYFKWWKALKSIIKITAIAKKISEKLCQKDRNIFLRSFEYLTSNEQEIREKIKRELKEMINKFKEENKKLGFCFSADEQTFLNLLKGNQTDYDTILIESRKILEDQKYFSCQEYIDPFKTNKQFKGNISLEKIAQNLNLEYFTLYDSKWAYYKIEDYTEIRYNSLSIDQGFPINIETDIQILPNVMSFLQNLNIEGNRNFLDYLQYLKNPQNQKAVSYINQAGQEYFFKAIQWQIIFQEIEQAIIKNYRVNGEIQAGQRISDYLDIFAKNDNESEQLTSQFNKMTQKLARGIFRDVNELIKKIDEEIEAFCMKVSEQGKVFIFLVTQIFTSLLTEKLEIIRESYPLRQFKNRKQLEKNLFIAKLTQNDAQMDKSNADKLAESLCQYFYQEKGQFHHRYGRKMCRYV